MRVSVLIPTRNGGTRFQELLDGLGVQSLGPDEVIVVDSSSTDGTAEAARQAGHAVQVIAAEEFDHAGTRNELARQARGDVLVFMTQDAVPADPDFLANLVGAIQDGVVAAYARHVPDEDARPTDAFHRRFNYPPEGHVRTVADVPRMGVRAYFFSNAAAAYDRDAFWEAGGFPERLIQSEDVALCARLLQAGHAVAYAADARVRHAHRLSLRRQFKRYFDTGAAFRLTRMPGARTTGEGFRFLGGQLAFLARHHPLWIPYAITEAALKFAGFRLGKAHRLLPRRVRAACSLRPNHWRI